MAVQTLDLLDLYLSEDFHLAVPHSTLTSKPLPPLPSPTCATLSRIVNRIDAPLCKPLPSLPSMSPPSPLKRASSLVSSPFRTSNNDLHCSSSRWSVVRWPSRGVISPHSRAVCPFHFSFQLFNSNVSNSHLAQRAGANVPNLPSIQSTLPIHQHRLPHSMIPAPVLPPPASAISLIFLIHLQDGDGPSQWPSLTKKSLTKS